MRLSLVREEKETSIPKAEHGIWSGEAIAFCPHCKAHQTVWINNGTLMPTRKFIQASGKIYHDCGSRQPCRLYDSS